MDQIIGGSGGGACSCGQYPPNCRCAEQAAKRSTDMAAVSALTEERSRLQIRMAAISNKLACFKVKCPTCRCRIYEWETCGCCAEPACLTDLDGAP